MSGPGPKCSTCGKGSRLVGGRTIYPHRPDLAKKQFWLCEPCNAYVGCHPGTQKPLGFPANAELRRARMSVHALLDPLWQGSRERRARIYCYRFLADKLGREVKRTHTGEFDLAECARAVEALRGVTFADVLRHRDEYKAALAALEEEQSRG